MKRSTNRILTTHVGSLARPTDLLEIVEHPELVADRIKARGARERDWRRRLWVFLPGHVYAGSSSHRRLGKIQSIGRGRSHRDEEAVAAHVKHQATLQACLPESFVSAILSDQTV